MFVSIRHSTSYRPRVSLGISIKGPSGGVNAAITAENVQAEILGILQTLRSYYDPRSATGYEVTQKMIDLAIGNLRAEPVEWFEKNGNLIEMAVRTVASLKRAIEDQAALIERLEGEKRALVDQITRT